MKSDEVKIWGKRLAFALRHRPDAFALKMDKNGWVAVDSIVTAFQSLGNFDKERLGEVVALDNKVRFSFNADKTMLRANQGHSVQVDVELKEAVPPEILFHGTGIKYVKSINEQGLLPQGRLYVHLSIDLKVAIDVGSRHGKPYVYKIYAAKMAADGYKFYLSANGVWLTKCVPVQYMDNFSEDKFIKNI